MIEIISVMVIVGILTAVAVSRLSSTSTYDLIAEAETLKTYLRYAQFRAMSDDARWKAQLNTTSCTLFHEDGAGAWQTSNLPDTPDSATHSFAPGVSKSGDPHEVLFDQWGSPGPTALLITLSNGADTRAITITQNTGFIP